MDKEISTIWGEMEWPHDGLHDKYMELLARMEGLEEELRGLKRPLITVEGKIDLMEGVSTNPNGAKIYFPNQLPHGMQDDIDELEIYPRTRNALHAAGITTITNLLSKRESDLLRLVNFGRKSLEDLNECLAACGWKLQEDSVRRKPPEEYETLYYKHLVPEIKRLERAGFLPDQIEKELRKSNPGNLPCVPTIKSILASKVYQ